MNVKPDEGSGLIDRTTVNPKICAFSYCAFENRKRVVAFAGSKSVWVTLSHKVTSR